MYLNRCVFTSAAKKYTEPFTALTFIRCGHVLVVELVVVDCPCDWGMPAARPFANANAHTLTLTELSQTHAHTHKHAYAKERTEERSTWSAFAF